jgi:PST family polysaccharide transporter
VAFVQLVLNYFIWVTNWGFHLNATRKIAAQRSNEAARKELFITTWAAQWVLAATCVFVLIAMILLIPSFYEDRAFYVCGVGLVFANILSPTWFLTGMEMLRESAIMQVIAKVAAIPLIFLFIRESADGSLYIAINAISGMAGGGLALWWLRNKGIIEFGLPRWRRIREELTDGTSLFVSSVSASLNTTITPTVLGVVAGPVALGYFALADRITRAALSILSPITGAVFPRMSNIFHDRKAAARLLYQASVLSVGVAAVLSLGLWLFAGPIVALLGGNAYAQSAELLKWLAPLIVIISVSATIGYQVLLPAHHNRAFALAYIGSAGVSLAMIAPLVRWKGATGAAINLLLTEILVAAAMALYVQRSRLLSRVAAED